MAKKKRRKLKKSRILLVLWVFIAVIAIPIYLLIPKNYGYNKEAISVFKEENIFDKIKENKKYSKTLEMAAVSNNFEGKYFDEYLNIEYIDDSEFINNVNVLLNIGYNGKEINTFYEKIPDSINVITENELDKNIIDYLSLDYFNEEYLDKYIKYNNDDNNLNSVYNTDKIKEDYNYEDTVTFVNAYLDKKYYTNDINLTNEEANKIDVIVNKYYKLDKNYEADDLTIINSKYAAGTQKLRKEAKEKFEEMCEAAQKDGYKIYAGSTYRTYNYQLNLYNKYVATDGFDAAETYSARAGYSEHQLGLAVDILNGKWNYLSEKDEEYKWLIDNSYKYGFILRYPRGKEYITGYMFEDWHFRYLGIELATKVYESGLTYEEYIARGLK